ncbi:activating signal cointegrator 1 complex subunit 2 isoform X2 [Salvia hispanica]|uniref:activating signal cointegrator 1 complex subunit 2 isoform X2 n=1 Tax=Salvia hispanica TaxID=49212 RepID=UPI00200980E0|nr:activating signal cointegrator 1 complex subunit 2 isoform X2 [Salvia hispanica]
MSNRSVNQNRNDYTSSAKSQKKFVPKRDFQNPNTHQTLSNTLRATTNTPTADTVAASASRVRTGEDGVNRASTSGNFVIYLPQDEAVAAGLEEGGLDPVESQRVVDLLNRELSRLLKLRPRDFWREVATDESLDAFLESFLKFRSRWYDFPHRGARGIVSGVIVGEFELCRRVFMVLYRLSSNRDPGAKAADSLSAKDHEALLQKKKLLELPKLLDICAIYGHENEELSQKLVTNVIKAQPYIQDDFPALISHFISIVQTMYQRCNSTLEGLLSSGGHQDQGSSRLHLDYLEVMDFINDSVVSLDSFVNAHKPAAVFFSSPVELSYGNEELLTTLVRLHDSFLPSLLRGFNILSGVAEDRNKEISISMKMFPANVEDPVVRADILIQTIRDLSIDHTDGPGGQTWGTLIQEIEKNHKMMSRIELLRETGWLSMDDEQNQFLAMIMRTSMRADIKQKSSTSLPASSDKAQTDEGVAIVESKISQIKELFPDYGRGFLVACLEAYNQDTEMVIQRILEGTLHEELQSLDISLETMPPSKSTLLVSSQDKGKGKLVVSAISPPEIVGPTVTKYQPGASSVSSSSSFGRFTRKNMNDLSDSETLNAKNEEALAKTAALASQLEYEDEYDDSFDDLGLSVGDSGLDESETLGEKHIQGRRATEADTGSSTSGADSSKWVSRKTPQFYVKDGKNYSYKVEGSVAVANQNEAKLVNLAQKELIHGLGRGGNLPLGAVKSLSDSKDEQNKKSDGDEGGRRGGRGTYRGRERGLFITNRSSPKSNEQQQEGQENDRTGGRGGFGRGRGRRGFMSSTMNNRSPPESNEQQEGQENNGAGVRGGFGRGGGRRGGGSGSPPESNEQQEGQENDGVGVRGGFGRGGGRRGGGGGRGRSNFRKDRAMSKHLGGLPAHYN